MSCSDSIIGKASLGHAFWSVRFLLEPPLVAWAILSYMCRIAAPVARLLAYSKNAILKQSNELVDSELEELPAEMLARFHYSSQLIEEFGLERVREPHVKHLRGTIWELRMKGKDGISRLSPSRR